MCEQCLVNPLYFGEVLPGYILIRARRKSEYIEVGDWGLVEANDPTYVWKSIPYKKTAKDRIFCAPSDFSDCFYGSPQQGFKLITAARQAGYSEGLEYFVNFESWFFDYLARWIETHEAELYDDAFPHLDEYMPHDNTLGKGPVTNLIVPEKYKEMLEKEKLL